MPRHNITPSALRQAETNPNAFLDAELEALYQALEKLFPSFSKEQVIEMVEKHKELHMLLEVYERSFTIVRRAYHNRRGPMLAQAKEQTRQAEEAGAPAYWVSHLREREAKLSEPYPKFQ